jgi:tRNA threonylcarbamoyladenosine modification (KEOPS) complex  Pcc1 subunit
MTQTTTITLELPDEKTAKWFAQSLSDPKTAGKSKEDEEIDGEAAGRASVKLHAKGKTVEAVVTGKDFAAMRARATTLLRDCKVVFDVLHATSGHLAGKK